MPHNNEFVKYSFKIDSNCFSMALLFSEVWQIVLSLIPKRNLDPATSMIAFFLAIIVDS